MVHETGAPIEKQKIEITPEMIRAGLARYYFLQEAGVSLDYLVAEVFAAMWSAIVPIEPRDGDLSPRDEEEG